VSFSYLPSIIAYHGLENLLDGVFELLQPLGDFAFESALIPSAHYFEGRPGQSDIIPSSAMLAEIRELLELFLGNAEVNNSRSIPEVSHL
jgi:hypothetical protein